MVRWLLPGALIALLLAAPAPAASLSGTQWRVTRIAGQPVAEFKLTLEFPGAEKFAGFDGCNRFGGRYSATATRLRFRGLFSTAIDCEGSTIPGLTQRLLRTRRYRLAGERLELRRRGRTLVVLRRR
jgi:heat shock protein HslJ